MIGSRVICICWGALLPRVFCLSWVLFESRESFFDSNLCQFISAWSSLKLFYWFWVGTCALADLLRRNHAHCAVQLLIVLTDLLVYSLGIKSFLFLVYSVTSLPSSLPSILLLLALVLAQGHLAIPHQMRPVRGRPTLGTFQAGIVPWRSHPFSVWLAVILQHSSGLVCSHSLTRQVDHSVPPI